MKLSLTTKIAGSMAIIAIIVAIILTFASINEVGELTTELNVNAQQSQLLEDKKAEIFQEFLTYTIATILGAIVIGYFMSRKLTSAIKHFTNVAEKVSMGDLSMDPTIKSNDEIGKLSDAFERMVTAIKFFMNQDSDKGANV